MLVKQDKTTIKPPFDPNYYIVTDVRGTKITGEGRGKTKTRNVEKMESVPQFQEASQAGGGEGNRLR